MHSLVLIKSTHIMKQFQSVDACVLFIICTWSHTV